MKLLRCRLIAIIAIMAIPAQTLSATCMKPNMKPEILQSLGFDGTGYDHDYWQTEPYEIKATFDGFVVSFDGQDDDNGDGKSDALGIPAFVAHQVKRLGDPGKNPKCIQKRPAPTVWCAPPELVRRKIAPTDLSYHYSNAWRRSHPDWFVRGALASAFLTERLGDAPDTGGRAAWNTHTVLNAAPQRASFNRGIWRDLEDITGRWAQAYGNIWIIAGPIIADGHAIGVIGTGSTKKVAIPDAFFKIVIRKNAEDADRPVVLAFLYPQVGPGYVPGKKGYDHTRFLTSVDEIEGRTGLDFLTLLSNEGERAVESETASTIWPHEVADDVKYCE